MLIPSFPFAAVPIRGVTEQFRRGTWREGWMTSVADRMAIVAWLRIIKAQYVVEIGVNEGYTAACVLENVDTVKNYLGIDVMAGHITTLAQQQGEVPEKPGGRARFDRRFKLMLREQGSLDLKPEEIGECDAMIIDGDHSRQAVLSDTTLAQQCVRKGGVIFWHDCCDIFDNDVRAVLEEMVAQGFPIRHVSNTWLAYLRIE